MAGSVYKCKYKNSSEELEMQVRKYAEYYNGEINFEDYYQRVHGVKLKHDGKDKCKLHDEVNGESFSYSRSSKIWSCWGSCKTTSAGVVEYHMMYLKKTKPYTTMIDALDSLKQMYPHLPKFTYSPAKKVTSITGLTAKRIASRVTRYHENKCKTTAAGTQPTDELLNDFDKLCFFCFTHNYIDKKEDKPNDN